MTKIIEEFIVRRKEQWLTQKIKSKKEDGAALKQKAEEQFSIRNWIENASLRAKQLHVVTHVAKLSHPDAKTSAFVASCPQKCDGYLRTGNVNYRNDVYGNAAALDVYNFLSLNLKDHLSILQAFERRDPELVQFIMNLELDFESLRENFLKIKNDEAAPQTSSLIKQVYFPIGENKYHLLSIVSPTGMMSELNQRIRTMRKNAKESPDKLKDSDCQEVNYEQLTNLTKIGFGGSKPQNISSINNQEHGVFFLLPSLPPELPKKYLRLPTEDFFKQSISFKNPQFMCEFEALERWLNSSLNNQMSRQSIRSHIDNLIDRILLIAQRYQTLDAGWTDAKTTLPIYQRIWLDQAFRTQRQNDDNWRDKLADRMAHWIIDSWERLSHRKRFGDNEIEEIKQLILSQRELF